MFNAVRNLIAAGVTLLLVLAGSSSLSGSDVAGATNSHTYTHASLIAALSKIHDWNALGLFGTHTLDINNRKTIVSGVGNCQWTTKFVGKTFHLVPGADPICGTVIPGVTVSP